jgi:hypothetical protein
VKIDGCYLDWIFSDFGYTPDSEGLPRGEERGGEGGEIFDLSTEPYDEWRPGYASAAVLLASIESGETDGRVLAQLDEAAVTGHDLLHERQVQLKGVAWDGKPANPVDCFFDLSEIRIDNWSLHAVERHCWPVSSVTGDEVEEIFGIPPGKLHSQVLRGGVVANEPTSGEGCSYSPWYSVRPHVSQMFWG